MFSTSQILDEELAKERLVDPSSYDFISGLSTSVLDRVAIDGGIYFLPVSNTMYGILYNKTLMEENGWELPSNFQELEALCAEIKADGLIPGILGTQLTGNVFSAVFNLAKTSWLTTPEGVNWEQDFLSGKATAAGAWERTMDYVQKYIDTGMFTTDPDDRSNVDLLEDYMAGRKAVFFSMAAPVDSSRLSNGDELGMIPYIGEDGSKNVYMYNPSSYIGVSKRLTETGNEEKLEKAIRVLTLLYSPEGQDSFVSKSTPCVMNVLNSGAISEDSLIYGAHLALREGRAFPMTYAHWENVLADMGQAYKEWIRGENGMVSSGEERYTFISDSPFSSGSYWAFVQKLPHSIQAGEAVFTHAVLLKDVYTLSQYYESAARGSQNETYILKSNGTRMHDDVSNGNSRRT